MIGTLLGMMFTYALGAGIVVLDGMAMEHSKNTRKVK